MHFQDDREVSQKDLLFLFFLQHDFYNNYNSDENLYENNIQHLLQARTTVALVPFYFYNLTNEMTNLPKEENQPEDTLDDFNYIEETNNVANLPEDPPIAEYNEMPKIETNKPTTVLNNEEDLSQKENKYTIKIINEKKRGKKKKGKNKKGKNKKNSDAKCILPNAKNSIINKIDNPSTKRFNEIQQKEFELFTFTKIKRKRTLTKSNKKKKKLVPLTPLKTDHDGKIYSDNQHYRKNKVFHIHFKKIKKYYATEDNENKIIKDLSSNELKAEIYLDFKNEQESKNMGFKNVLNPREESFKKLKKTQKCQKLNNYQNQLIIKANFKS